MTNPPTTTSTPRDTTPAPATASAPRTAGRLKGLVPWRQSGLIGALILPVTGFTALFPPFFSAQNALNILLGASAIAIIAMGEAFVIATSGIDLSVGSIAALAGIAGASFLQAGLPVWVAIVGA